MRRLAVIVGILVALVTTALRGGPSPGEGQKPLAAGGTKPALSETRTVRLAVGEKQQRAATSEVTIRSAGGFLTTETFKPGEAKVFDEKSPKPVMGRASDEELRSLKPLVPPDAKYKLRRALDGRYLVDEPEVIIGPDDRVRVGNPSAWPYRVHGHTVMRFPNGKTYIGTGTLVNKHHVLTAGHCVYSKDDGGWATYVQFTPAQDDASVPFGSSVATRLLSMKGWTDDNDRNYDIGMLILDKDLGNTVGYFGLITTSDGNLQNYRVNISGYPGDKGGRQQWTAADLIKTVQAERLLYDIDTVGGQSGSGVWSVWSGLQGEKVCGVHTTGSSSGNGATRLSRSKFDRIATEWFVEY